MSTNNVRVTTALKKRFKKLYYETRGISVTSLICLMLVGGLLLPLVFSLVQFYNEAASSKASVDLFYDEIADAQYPDRSRFAYYDFVDQARVEEALERVQAQGIYQEFSIEDLRDCFSISSSLDSAVRETVENARSGGADYSYVANEYSIVFTQPHANGGDPISVVTVADHSSTFLEALMDVNYNYFVQEMGGSGGFRKLMDAGDMSVYDYGEKITIYIERVDYIISALNQLNREIKDFTSTVYDRTLKDLVGEYKLLRSHLSSLQNFVESSGLTRDLEVERNKLNTNLENNTLNFNKASDMYDVNTKAESAYDHTFTENLIVVARDYYSDRLYQARPKTGFDTVVDRKHEGMESKAYYRAAIDDLNATLERYATTTYSEGEYERLCDKCEELLAAFDASYAELCEMAGAVVAEAYDYENRGFMSYRIEKCSILSVNFLIKNVILFCVGVVCTFVVCVLINSWGEYRKLKKKERILNKLHKGNDKQWKGA